MPNCNFKKLNKPMLSLTTYNAKNFINPFDFTVSLSYRDSIRTKYELLKLTDGNFIRVPLDVDSSQIYGILLSQNNKNRIIITIENGKPEQLHLYEKNKTRLLLDTDVSCFPKEKFATYESHIIESFDGIKINTHILKPKSATAKNPLPMILYVHGGPRAYEDPIYSAQDQFFADAGFIIVIPNVRGSSGFGKEFMDMLDGDWGGDHIKDLLAVADYASNFDYVANRPRFIMGGSFGGFSVLSTITQYPKTFDGAIDICGISDISTLFAGTPEQGKPDLIKRIGFDPRENIEKAKAISPIYHIDKIEIPLQIHQGIEDQRVLLEQSRMMVKELKKKNKSVKYYEYNSGHGFAGSDDELSRQRMKDFLLKLSIEYGK